jgi:hypothetical protein
MLKRTALFLALCLAAVISPWAGAQTTQITASHIAYFGGTTVTGTFCLTPTNQAGQPINIVTSVGQQISPQVPLCFPITSGVLSSSAIVPDTSLTQPANACYSVVISNFYGAQVGVFPCVQPSGSTWSFDAFVPSSMPAIPVLTFPQFKHNGVTNSSQASLNIACSGCTESPAGTINIPSGALPTAPGAGYAPISSGPGTTYTPQPVTSPYPSNTQYVQQPLDNGFFTSFNVNFQNKVFNVDAFNSYGGIGVAPIAFSSPSTDFPECQVVTYGGNAYIAINAANHTVTPGTLSGVWWPVPNTIAGDAGSCAAAVAQSYKDQNNVGALVVFGSGSYNVGQQLASDVTGSGFTDQFTVSYRGAGGSATYINYIGSAAIPVISRPTGAGNFASMSATDMTVNAGGTGSASLDVDMIGGGSDFRRLNMGNVATGAAFVARIGHTGGYAFQVPFSDNNIGIFPDVAIPNCAVVAASGTGSTISFTVPTPGSCYATPTARLVAHVLLLGTQNGTAAKPCTVMPTGGMVPSFSGSGLAGITNATGATGCAGPYYVQVYESTPVTNGLVYNGSDSHDINNNTSYLGDAGAFVFGASDVSVYGAHPSVVVEGIIANTSVTFDGTECDAVFDKCFTFNHPFTTTGFSVAGTKAYIGGGVTTRLFPGSTVYYFPTTTSPVNFSASGPLCESGGPPTGWNEFLTQTGPIVNPADYSKIPAGSSVYGNDAACGEAMGDYASSLSVGTFSQASVNVLPLGTATIGTNYSSGIINIPGSYYNGGALADTWTVQNLVGSGTNPSSTLSFAHTGSSGGSVINLPGQTNINGPLNTLGGTNLDYHTIVGAGPGTLAEYLGTAIAAAATIAPTSLVTHITGTAATVNTITEPSGCRVSNGQVCEIKLISDAGFLMGTGGNISVAKTTVTGQMYVLAYDNNTSKWYPTN